MPVEVIDTKKATSIRDCLLRFLGSFHYVHTIFTDNSSEFTDRGTVSKKNKPHDKPSGEHLFDILCSKRGIEHRLSEAIRRYPITKKHRNPFKSKETRVAYIEDFVYAYNRTRLKCIDYKAPLEHLRNNAEQYT